MHFALPTAAAELNKIKQGSNNEDMSTSLLLSFVEPNEKGRLGVQLRGGRLLAHAHSLGIDRV